MNRTGMRARLFLVLAVTAMVPLLVAGCGAARAAAQPPDEYLANALNWIESRSVMAPQVDFASVRRDALALIPTPRDTTETHAAIRHALAGTRDGLAWLYSPNDPVQADPGFFVTYPELVANWVTPGGAAERAGVHAGDRLLQVNGAAPGPQNGNLGAYDVDFGLERQVRVSLGRDGRAEFVEVTIDRDAKVGFDYQAIPDGRTPVAGIPRVAYLNLIYDPGSPPYPGRVQRLMQELDRNSACGWIVDLRRNPGGDTWSYLASLGPLLGEGDAGGFVYADGRRETWGYRDGKVYWHGEERGESKVEGGIYTPHNPAAPIAFLTSYTTVAAGELVIVAFEGRPNVTVFGEPTRGLARLADSTPLSDGAQLFVSGAYATDRTGKRYDAPIQPDQLVKTDWTKLGTDEDPVIRAAAAYLSQQPTCKGG